MRPICLAAAQYPIERLEGLEDYEAKTTDWVARAAGAGAALLIFPDGGSIELAAFAPDPLDRTGAISHLHRMTPEIDALHQSLARRHDVHILASAAPVQGGDGLTRAVTRLFAPCGKIGRQEKLVMTRRDREDWHLSAGGPICVFRTRIGTIGVCAGYDVEFPLVARAMAEAGAEIILTPCASDSPASHRRARIAAAARALENQCYVVLACTVGAAPWAPAMGDNCGSAAVFVPPGGRFGEDGVVALGRGNEAMWLQADIDLDLVAQARGGDDARVFADWAEQGIVTAPAAEIVDLR